MTAPSVLRLTGIAFRYAPHGAPALHDLSVSFPDAAVTTLLGPNGGGKTTLLHLLVGLLTPQAGTLEFAERQADTLTRPERGRLVGLVPQHEHIPFDISVLDYVLFGRAPHLGLLDLPGDSDEQAARAALATVGITPLGQRPITTLSGGERQLAMIARALAQEPRILLLDEPTSHLDLAHRRAVHDVLRALAQKGVAVIFSTHDPNLAAALADHVVLLRQGSLLAAGAPKDVLTSDHLSATYGIPVEVVTLEGRPVILS